MVEPGFGRLTDARVLAIDNARQRESSNLRDSLNQRRVLGSSFADNALNRQALEFAQEEESARAESFLQEMDMTRQFVLERAQLEEAQVNNVTNAAVQAAASEAKAAGVQLDELNALAGIASNAASQATQVSMFNSQLDMQAAQMNAKAASGEGGFLGTLAGIAGGAIGGSIAGPAGASVGSSLLGGSSGNQMVSMGLGNIFSGVTGGNIGIVRGQPTIGLNNATGGYYYA